jgi:signal peptidase I
VTKKRGGAALARESVGEPTKPAEDKKKGGGLWGTVRSIGPAVLLALAVRAFLFEPFSIPSGSMLPTLQIGDYVVVTKFAYGVRIPFTNTLAWERKLPARGDVVVFDHPLRTGDDLIKRVVGLPGDEIRLVDSVVYVNGVAQGRRLLEADFAFDDYSEGLRRWIPSRGRLYVETLERGDGGQHRNFVIEQLAREPDEGPFRVPEGHVFVMGDNRDNSADSRRDGVWYVPVGHIRGRADVIGFSWGQDGFRGDRFFRSIDAGVPEA